MVILARENSELRAQYQDAVRRAVQPHRGLYVPAIPTETLDGRTVRLGASAAGNQLLVFLNDTCNYCRASIPAWKRVARALEGEVEVIGVAFDSVPEARAYAEEHELPFPVVSAPDRKIAALYRASGVPLIMAVDSGGRVLYSRHGLLESDAAIDSVIRAAHESLTAPAAR